MQVHVSGAAARRVRFVYGELSAVPLQCAFLFVVFVFSMESFCLSGIVPLLTALLIHVDALWNY